ncbi:RDD domain protein [Oleiphilus messinensis]|uniref:RDD domain protein n=1 Tax=Oleiphilus messinensis TaxID=141451 RepID=A0A1Y0IE14_9GAMM|nr:RDD family protein [Oleiphilus messinensis]ARU57614.1 RDD domain protein [Oleiphilus messinensis]
MRAPSHTPYPESAEELQSVSLFRRLVAMLYDTLITVALLMVTTGFYKMIQAKILGTEKLKQLTEAGHFDTDPLLSSILFIVMFLFYGYFWTKSGQTLGMQVWHIRIQTREGYPVRWTQALLRFFMAWVSALCFGLGYLWILVDKKKRAWHDHFSLSEVVRIPKRKK